MKKVKSLVALMAIAATLASCNNTARFSKLALGGENVPVGQYSSKILAYLGLDEKALAAKNLITYGDDVKVVTSQVAQSLVSAGIIYQTDAYSAKLTVVDTATAEMCGQVIYPAAVMKNDIYKAKDASGWALKQSAAKSVLSYLRGKEAMDVFESVGFSKMGEYPSEVAQISDKVNVTIYAAASMTETMNTLKAKYETAHSNVTLSMNYGSSGKLQTQIEEGGDCDIFISAGQNQMNNIDKSGGTQTEKDYVLHDTRVDLLENKVALAVPSGNPAGISSFEVLKEKLLEASKESN